MKLYTIYDAKTETYFYPMRAFNQGHMIREISDLLKNQEHQFTKHPEDHTLFEMGEWDEATGQIELYAAKKPLGCLIEFKQGE